MTKVDVEEFRLRRFVDQLRGMNEVEVHEQPTLGRGPGELVAGDVIAVEPGLYRNGYGGCRLEDIVLVTENGAEVLTEYPYDLAP